MTTLKFNPQVFRVKLEGSHGGDIWDLLTLDGESPNETIYFMLDEDIPSWSSQEDIAQAVENEEWEAPVHLYSTKYNLVDFDINPSMFDTAGMAYDVIRKVCTIQNIAKEYGVRVDLDENQDQVYIISDERLCNDFGDELTEEANEIEKKVMEAIGCDGALLQSKSEEIDFYTLAFNINL